MPDQSTWQMDKITDAAPDTRRAPTDTGDAHPGCSDEKWFNAWCVRG